MLIVEPLVRVSATLATLTLMRRQNSFLRRVSDDVNRRTFGSRLRNAETQTPFFGIPHTELLNLYQPLMG
jgi:hypothetical protein